MGSRLWVVISKSSKARIPKSTGAMKGTVLDPIEPLTSTLAVGNTSAKTEKGLSFKKLAQKLSREIKLLRDAQRKHFVKRENFKRLGKFGVLGNKDV